MQGGSTSASAPAARPRRVIAFMNQKGGVGKTTTAVNIAAGIAAKGRSVLLIDLDPQAHATLHLAGSLPAGAQPAPAPAADTGGPGPSLGVYDVLTDPAVPIAAAARPARDNLLLLGAETDLAGVETELSAATDRLLRLRAKLAAWEGPAEFVLIDCPPSLGVLTLNALAAAREVFIPMQAQFLALQGVGKLMETVSLVARGVNPRLHVTGVILTNHDTTTSHGREVVADLDGFFAAARGTNVAWRNARVYRPAVRRNVKLAEAPSFGQTIFEYAPGCPGAADYAQLAGAIVKEWDEVAGAPATAAAPPAPAGPVIVPGQGRRESAAVAGARAAAPPAAP